METIIVLYQSVVPEIMVCTCGQVSMIAQSWEDAYPLRVTRGDNFYAPNNRHVIFCKTCGYLSWNVVPGVLTLLRNDQDPYITEGDWRNLHAEREAAKAAYNIFLSHSFSLMPTSVSSLKMPVTIYGRQIAQDKEE